ncbi:MAG: LCP family protein [Actinomycetes bacterium]
MSLSKPTTRGWRKIFLGVNIITIGLFFVLISAVGLVVATKQQEGNVHRANELNGILADKEGPFVNYLLVGSDSRAGIDANELKTEHFGKADGRRSDTVMILHVDNILKTTSILSVPRDLWLEIPGHGKNRLNAAYGYGADVLVRTIQESLGIPLNHYLEVNFVSFKQIIAALGGVDICFDYPTRDHKTGLDVPTAGCYTLDNSQSLAYARSRYFEVFKDGQWRIDGRADLGRIERQQTFFAAAVAKAISQTTANPLRTSELVNAAVSSVTVDGALNILETANFLRPLASGGMQRFKLSVLPETIDDKAVLVLGSEAKAVLDYFAGISGPPNKQQ